jgi:hypothetical protein
VTVLVAPVGVRNVSTPAFVDKNRVMPKAPSMSLLQNDNSVPLQVLCCKDDEPKCLQKGKKNDHGTAASEARTKAKKRKPDA